MQKALFLLKFLNVLLIFYGECVKVMNFGVKKLGQSEKIVLNIID